MPKSDENSAAVSESDLVLDLDLDSSDAAIKKIGCYEPFIAVLCRNREYQKQAIRTALGFILSTKYSSTKALFEYNFKKPDRTEKLVEAYSSVENWSKRTTLCNRKACTIDMATGTGKSYVMYGIARILLCEGIVDRVLILSPSNVIQESLKRKFNALSQDRTLSDQLPPGPTPRISDGSSTIKPQTICIENSNVTYENVGSSLTDSLKDTSHKTLVLNDEVHHVYMGGTTDDRKWLEFLKKYSFKYLVGFSGTAYQNDEYLPDVIFRYPIKDAMSERFVKGVDYRPEDDKDQKQYQQFQQIYQNHLRNKKDFPLVKKHITFFVTKDTEKCTELGKAWQKFLVDHEKYSAERAEKSAVIVHSKQDYEKNTARLYSIDSVSDPAEFVFCVNKASEGWDAQNVFQIVPHEERAFNSKLLIAQVLGRGLRMPPEYEAAINSGLDVKLPSVVVFNHAKWSKQIESMVWQVTGQSQLRLKSQVNPKSKYNFKIHNLNYEKALTDEVPQKLEIDFFKNNKSIDLSEQSSEQYSTDSYIHALTREIYQREYTLRYTEKIPKYAIDEVVKEAQSRLKWIDRDRGTKYASRYPPEMLRKVLENSLDRLSGRPKKISEENKQKFLSLFGTALREKIKITRLKRRADCLETCDTATIVDWSEGERELITEGTVFFPRDGLEIPAEEIKRLEKFLENEKRPVSATQEVSKEAYKTPLTMFFTQGEPERKFFRKLTADKAAEKIDSWIKSRDRGFYSIEYTCRKGSHQDNGQFNPDLFIKQGKKVIVVEIKSDEPGDLSAENWGKLKDAREHFNTINKMQKSTVYEFHMITPQDYDVFFDKLVKKETQDINAAIEKELERRFRGAR